MSPEGCQFSVGRRKRRQSTLTLDSFVDDGAELGIGLGHDRVLASISDQSKAVFEEHIVPWIRVPLRVHEERDLEEPVVPFHCLAVQRPEAA